MLHDALRILMDAFITILSTAGNVLKQQAGCSVGQRKPALWRQAVDVLTVVNNFAEIFPDFRPVLRATLSATEEPLDLLLRQAKRGTNLHWLLKCKDVAFSFEAKRNLVLMLLPEVGASDFEEQHEMLINRSNLLAESFEHISQASPSDLRYELLIEFRASSTDSMNLAYFKFSGRLIALALMHKVQIGITFDRTFFLQLAGKPITLEDVKDADPFLYASCKWILDMDPALVDSDALGLTFSRDVEVLGSIKNVELSTGGKDIVVNSTNRESYVNLLIEHSFVTSVAYQVEQFARGFADILSDRTHQRLFFESLELEDVDRLLYGSGGAISLTEWKQHTMYECYKEKDDQIQWFWKIIEEMSDEQRRVLLFFWTAVKYLPAEGFKGLNSKLCIHRATSPDTALPVSQTCFYRLSIPAYSSESTMRNRLQFITQEHVSCSFGMG
ncbi:E3 ubiquitin-protein ligase UPL5 [Ananas comosus]|uniref:HECT-type E3 ubiquitin transferase n=1 Tax=Ananas comosus TaxID=4615 RepID=A0A199VH53_ANACO|nr:E3 ubiquitin-protein ligase UPL5 [Ananas comosus]